MDSIIGLLIENAVKPVCSFAKKHFLYVVCKSELVKDLTVELKELEDKKMEIDMRVRGARGRGEDIVPPVDKWVEQAETLIEEVKQFLDHEKMNSDNRSGFNQCFCSICNHHKTGEEATNTLNTLREKLKRATEQTFFEVGISASPSQPADMALDPTAYCEGYVSRESLLKKIIKALEVNDMIGICGMAGVGKTMLVQRLAIEVKRRNLFDVVGIAEVLRPPDLAAIRNIIADRMLHVQLQTCNSEEGKRDKLNEKLKSLMHQQQKNVLLVLDDAWEPFHLHQVGIPKPEKGFKIVVTSRSQNVCFQMEAEKTFEVCKLEPQEASNLFWRSLGRFSETLVPDKDYKGLAKEMVVRLDGLPLALVNLARSLKGEKLDVWNYAACKLRENSLDKIEGMSENVIKVVKLSLEWLRDRKEQAIFFFCCLFPESYHIDVEVLVKYGIGWGLFYNCTLVEAMGEVAELIRKFKSRSLLLRSNEERMVKMHDVIRDTTLHMASKGEFEFRVGEYRSGRINGVPNDDVLREKHAILITSKTCIEEFFQHNGVMTSYPNLRILRLRGVKGDHVDYLPPCENSTCFFEGIETLQVLEMSSMGISNFPSSLDSLKGNLRTVCLHDCKIEDITKIGELTCLEILDLHGSTICSGLHRAVRRLSKLRMLDLTSCHVDEIFENLVVDLQLLEGLYMMGMVRLDRSKPIIESLVRLETLLGLKVLEIVVRRPEQFSYNFLSVIRSLFSFKICVSSNLINTFSDLGMRCLGGYKILCFEQVKDDGQIGQCLDQLLRVVDSLLLICCYGFAPIMFCYRGEGLSNLRYLHLESCPDVEFVRSGPNMKTDDQLATFAELEALTLDDLSGVKTMCALSQHVDLSKLKSLIIRRCGMLPYVFTKSVARQLQKLKEFKLEFCDGMEQIFTIDNDTSGNSSSSNIMDDIDSIVLPSLQDLAISNASKAKHFSPKNRNPAQSAFFGEQVQLPVLRSLLMSSLPSCGNIWEGHLPTESFGLLRRLTVGDCTKLRSIFSAAVARGLVQLKELRINRCDKLEEVVVIESGNNDEIKEESKNITFPQLQSIKLINLKSLQSFCLAKTSALEFPSLEEVVMHDIDNMQKFSCGSLQTPKLHVLLSEPSNPYAESEKFWKSDLNTTVSHLYEERKRKLAEEK